eukprot:jgi/Botrbrau1/6177/Bobra.0344s0017.1
MTDTTAPEKEQTAAAPAPVFGASSALGSGGGFGGFAATESSRPVGSGTNEADDDGGADAEEECAAEFKPLVELQEVETVSGEEEENVLSEFKSKLYRFDNGEWKERGVGQLKLLEHKESKKIRLLFRQEKTLKIRANHMVMPGTKLQEHTGSEKAWVYSTFDFADETQKMELFCLRFASVERAAEFKKAFEEAMVANEKLVQAEEGAEEGEDESEEAKKAADATSEKKEEEKKAAAAADEVAEALGNVAVKDE